jgi:DnaA family protein
VTPAMEQLPLVLAPPPPPTLDNFVAGRNGAALSALREAAAGRAGATVFYLWGEPGSGRTHLLRAAAAAGLAAVDDADRLDAAAQIALFDAINEARAVGAAVVVSGSRPPAQLAVREDLRTRLGSGLAFELVPLSDAEKAEALRARAAALGMKLPEEVLAYLLTHLRRDMGTQIAMVDALDRYSLARQRALTLPLVRAALAARDA